MDKSNERRLHHRGKSRCMVKFQTKPVNSDEVFSDWDIAIGENVSAGGVLFNYDKPLNISSLLGMEIKLPPNGYGISTSGYVTRIDKCENSPRFRVAAAFADLEESEIEKIDKIVIENLS